MGIRLDWEIEAEQEQIRNIGEDPEGARRRRRARTQLFLLLVLLFMLIGGVIGAVALRLRQIDWQIEQDLRDTVVAEVTALRLGSESEFLTINLRQRPEWDAWTQQQVAVFDRYQALKVEQDVNLTGQVLDAVVDGQRGRVRVEEIIGGVPYAQIWFYWRFDAIPEDDFDGGWYHVPPDYTFWGAAQEDTFERLTVAYSDVDLPLAAEIGPQVTAWLGTGCAVLNCAGLPTVTLAILPEPIEMGWSPTDPWRLELPSPYIDRARLDMPFEPRQQIELANLLAERLVTHISNDLQPQYPADAYYLRSAVVSWLAGEFTQLETNAHLIRSLAENYQPTSVGALLRALTPTSDVSAINQVLGVESLEAADRLDWRDYLTWRLQLEGQLGERGDEGGFLALYDTSDPFVRDLADSRYNAGSSAELRVVVAVVAERNSNAVPQLRTRTRVGQGDAAREEEIVFRLVDGVWKRAS
ncbi:MAG: hypothetical protein GYB67_16705 [Chloroflexi bacterium]|nr:hypothetical protein [Chloroflexota bacterium]